jgi:hypothetical protein
MMAMRQEKKISKLRLLLMLPALVSHLDYRKDETLIE